MATSPNASTSKAMTEEVDMVDMMDIRVVSLTTPAVINTEAATVMIAGATKVSALSVERGELVSLVRVMVISLKYTNRKFLNY